MTTPLSNNPAANVLCNREAADKKTDLRETCHKDSKGRLIGGLVQTATVTHVPVPEGQSWGYRRVAGSVVYTYTPCATRDGVHYGASHAPVDFDTAEARDAAVEKYFAGVAKRAAKNAAA